MADLPNPAQAINDYVTLGTARNRARFGRSMRRHDQPCRRSSFQGALHGVADVEQSPDQRLDPAECPPLVIGEPVRQWAPPQLSLQPGPLPGRKPFPRERPCGLQRRRPAVAPGPPPPPHRPRRDPQVPGDLADPASGGEPPGRLQP